MQFGTGDVINTEKNNREASALARQLIARHQEPVSATNHSCNILNISIVLCLMFHHTRPVVTGGNSYLAPTLIRMVIGLHRAV